MVKRIVTPNGTIIYKNENGKMHREDGPALIEPDGTKGWYRNGKIHREDGPAIIWSDGKKEWWLNGKRHRENGPAAILSDGEKEWWLNNELYSFKEWIQVLNISDEEKMELMLYHG